MELSSIGKVSAMFPLEKSFKILSASGLFQGRDSVTIGQLIKKPGDQLIVNFWATWCPPCLEELPSLEYLHRELKLGKGSSGPLLVAISVDDTAAAVMALFATLESKPSFLILHDPSGEFARSVGTSKFPETYLINSNGEVAYKWLGPQDWLSSDVVERLHN